jgi:CubicO group peptidase (beta-lactamase class C family)
VFSEEAIHPALADATLLDLASHRAGLPRDPDVDDDERAAILAVSDPVAQREVLLHRELPRAPTSPRGSFVYSNLGFVLLGVAIERAAGEPFEAVMQSRLFAPLGMVSCGFAVPEGGAPYGHAADGSVADAATVIPSSYGPAGGVHCTLDDWARYLADHLAGEHGGSRLLDAESYLRLHTPPEGAAYAFGWNIETTAGGRQLTHAGSNGFWMALVRVSLDVDHAAVLATNIGDVDLERMEAYLAEVSASPAERR